MKKRFLTVLLIVALAVLLAVTLTACVNNENKGKTEEQSPEVPSVPDAEIEYVVDVLNFTPEHSRDLWSYGGAVEKGKTTVRVHFTAPLSGEYVFLFEARALQSGKKGAKITGADLNGEKFDFSGDYENLTQKTQKMTRGTDYVFTLEIESEDEYGYYGFNFKVREGSENMLLLPGEEGTFAVDPQVIGNGVKRYYVNSEDGIEFVAAYQMNENGWTFDTAAADGGTDRSRLDVPINGGNKTYITVKNTSDKEQSVVVTEGAFEELNAPGDTIEIAYTGNEACKYLIKVRFTKSNMRICVREKGQQDLYSGSIWISGSMWNAQTGEYSGTVYILQPGEYQVISNSVGGEYCIEFTVRKAGTYIFELSEIG